MKARTSHDSTDEDTGVNVSIYLFAEKSDILFPLHSFLASPDLSTLWSFFVLPGNMIWVSEAHM